METVKIVSLGGETTYGRDVAGAPVSLFACRRPWFVNRYGSSETSILAEWVVTPDDDARADEPLPLGHVLPWAEIVVVDDAGEPIAGGRSGFPRSSASTVHSATGTTPSSPPPGSRPCPTAAGASA